MATMFPCPNCGGQLRYSIKGQKLKCQSCGEYQDVNTYKPNDEINTDTINTSIYVCPNCNGEIQLIDNDGMEFCPYCGTQATMQEKFSSEGAPKYILPFSVSKNLAKEKYEAFTKKLHFAPEGLEEDENIDKLVPLYVPYYMYEYSVHGDVTYKGKHSFSKGDYWITDYANVTLNMGVDNVEVPFDGSQALDDTIAEAIEPFPMDKLEKFNPNYLAGFFVENSSVDKDLYKEDSVDKAIDYVYKKALQETKTYEPEGNGRNLIKNKLVDDMRFKGVEGAYLPLYFLTTRYNDRVAYSIINGSTGETYMDMPIDKRKMFGAAIKYSAIVFVVIILASFLLGFSYKIKNLCAISSFISALIAFTGANLANKRYRSDNHLDDKGYFQNAENAKGKVKPKAKKSMSGIGWTLAIFVFAVAIFGFFTGYLNYLIKFLVGSGYFFGTVLAILSLFKVGKGKKKVMLLGITGWILSLVIRFINLPNDIFYYGALIVAFIVIIISVNAIVDEYNAFATRPSPQFLKKGGGLEHA